MSAQFDKLQERFKLYYESEFKADAEDSLVNRSIRTEAVSLLTEALTKRDLTLADQVLHLLAENTGCAEDAELFGELTKPLLESGMLTQAQADMVLHAKAIGRWIR